MIGEMFGKCPNPACEHGKNDHSIEMRMGVIAVRCETCAAVGRSPCCSHDYNVKEKRHR